MSRLYKILLGTLLLFACGPAFAGKRVALVLGNSAYQNVPRLPNPVNDGAVIAATLKDAGFDVVDFREIFAPETAVDHPYYSYVPAEWAKRWPGEEIWRARKR